MTNQEIITKINQIEARNKKVELDKAWETSWTRKICIIIFTYLCVSIFMIFIKAEQPFVNAIVPALGFTLSTLSLPYIKNIWLKKNN